MTMTSASSLVQSPFGLAAAFLAEHGFFANFTFLASREPFVGGGSAAGVLRIFAHIAFTSYDVLSTPRC
jgi:hypothetical protein